jgi:DNA-binding GntR family transcriptional regulator
LTKVEPVEAGASWSRTPEPMHAPSTLELRNLPDRLADHLAIMIAKGELKPGQRIFEKQICEVQGVSRIPVREALRLLQAQGVVRTEPNRGTYVTEFTPHEMFEMLELRHAVERLALSRIVDRGLSKPQIAAHFSGVLNAMRRAASLEDRLAYCQADLAFHSCIVELSCSPVLKPTWQLLSRGVLVFLLQEQEYTGHFEGLIAAHERIVSALQSGRREAVEAEIECHILEGIRADRAGRGTRIPATPV